MIIIYNHHIFIVQVTAFYITELITTVKSFVMQVRDLFQFMGSPELQIPTNSRAAKVVNPINLFFFVTDREAK
jgi:hypothetical protein